MSTNYKFLLLKRKINGHPDNNNKRMHEQLSPMDWLHKCEEILPFPVFRHIMDYSRKHTFSKAARHNLQTHFKDRMCGKCGEYMDYPLHRLKATNKKRRPRHLTCRTPKYQIVSGVKHYRLDVNVTDIFNPIFLNTGPFTGMTPRKCPVLIKTKRECPIFWTEMVFHQNSVRRDVSKCVFYPVEMSILPEDGVVSSNWDKSRQGRHHIARIADILWFLFGNMTGLTYNAYHCRIYERLIREIPERHSLIKLRLIRTFNINSIAILNHRWMREILLEFPEVLNDMQDDIITDFFIHNRHWFLSVLCPKRPVTLKYITLYFSTS